MVEVFRTNVNDRNQAKLLIEQIHNMFDGYDANFDLEDKDRILRIKCTTRQVQSFEVINLLKEFGFIADVLPNEYPVTGRVSLTLQGYDDGNNKLESGH